MSGHAGRQCRWSGWSLAGAGLAFLGFAWIIQRLDLADLQATIVGSDPLFLAMVPIAILGEQLVRAWKWRQILHSLRPIGTLRLFGAIMAGYLANLLVPLGLSPLVRSWLVARLEGLTMSGLLASVAIDRLIDGVVFAALVLFVVVFAVLPDPSGDIRLALVVGATSTLGGSPPPLSFCGSTSGPQRRGSVGFCVPSTGSRLGWRPTPVRSRFPSATESSGRPSRGGAVQSLARAC